MCGRFTQYNSREEYLSFLGEEAERDIPYDPEPVGRYNVAPGTRVLLLSERRSQLHLDPVQWGYAPEWWNKPALINARSETAASSRMFRPLWEHGRAIVFADGWFEWKQQNGVKQPFFIYRKDGNPLLLAAIGKPPFENSNDQEGFLIVTAAADEGLLDIHDRRPLVYSPTAARKWLSENTTGKEAEDIAREGSLSAEDFTWHPVSRAVGNPRNQGRELIEPLA
ncbi:SOS response-associated peptidase family protein [Salmonella enterica]|nr:DNA breaking-rejoining protein [Salmonella enterica]ELG6307698.1 SOS response-associated peptidase family protein [Salmonella enterica]